MRVRPTRSTMKITLEIHGVDEEDVEAIVALCSALGNLVNGGVGSKGHNVVITEE